MVTYTAIQRDRRKCLALTGLTLPEFQLLLPAFTRAYEAAYPANQTLAGRPRQRSTGGGRKGALHPPEQKLLFILVYLKTYPLQVVMAELFGVSQSTVNDWIHRLLPVLQAALAELGVRPERDPHHFGQVPLDPSGDQRLIIDGTERRRQRPKNPEKQALHYSGKKKTHTDKNVVVVGASNQQIGFLSATYVGKAHEKGIVDQEGITYPPGTVLYQDTGFQGYEPAVAATRQAKKKAAPRETHASGKAHEPEAVPRSGQGGACVGRSEAVPHRERRSPKHPRRDLRLGHRSSQRLAQPPSTESQRVRES
jgi:DDE superfamily endonuclease